MSILKTYSIEFHTLALKEWKKLDCVIQQQFKKQLEKRLANPHASSASLHGNLANFYKIKLKAVGYRLGYEVIDHKLIIMISAVGKRDRFEIYQSASKRKYRY